jgi:hypothetical protein
MNYLNGKLVMKGDAAVHVTPEKYAVVGTVVELYERDETLRIGGYPLRVPANKVVLAGDAYAALVDALPKPVNAPTSVPTPPVAVETPPTPQNAPEASPVPPVTPTPIITP